jgi:phosphate starvation-inducible membrane PsiE
MHVAMPIAFTIKHTKCITASMKNAQAYHSILRITIMLFLYFIFHLLPSKENNHTANFPHCYFVDVTKNPTKQANITKPSIFHPL